jgi:hypothetical protein
VAALGATAASAAQAHEWTINGESLVKHEVASESLSFSKASNFKFAFRAAEINWKWTCAPIFEEGSIGQGGTSRSVSAPAPGKGASAPAECIRWRTGP